MNSPLNISILKALSEVRQLRFLPIHNKCLRRIANFVVISIFTTSLTSCSFGAESSPRLIPDGQRRTLSAALGSPRSLDSKVHIYLPVRNITSVTNLGSVARNIDEADDEDYLLQLLNELIAWPSTAEENATFTTAIPKDTQVLGVSLVGIRLTVNLSGTLNQLPDEQLIIALAQIVYTMSEGFYDCEVIIKIEGQNVEWPRQDGTRTSDPLTIFDYPTAAITSQPAYPGIISTESVA